MIKEVLPRDTRGNAVDKNARPGREGEPTASWTTIVISNDKCPMKYQLTPEQEILHRAVGEVLHYIWDPIGVAGIAQARDEYDGYVDDICTLLWQDAGSDLIAEHLVEIAEHRMGIPDTERLAQLAACKLIQWRAVASR